MRQERFPFLAHPGRVYHLVRDRGEKVVVVGRQAASLFSEKICLFQVRRENIVKDVFPS